jgi:hypothetical protein
MPRRFTALLRTSMTPGFPVEGVGLTAQVGSKRCQAWGLEIVRRKREVFLTEAQRHKEGGLRRDEHAAGSCSTSQSPYLRETHGQWTALTHGKRTSVAGATLDESEFFALFVPFVVPLLPHADWSRPMWVHHEAHEEHEGSSRSSIKPPYVRQPHDSADRLNRWSKRRSRMG